MSDSELGSGAQPWLKRLAESEISSAEKLKHARLLFVRLLSVHEPIMQLVFGAMA